LVTRVSLIGLLVILIFGCNISVPSPVPPAPVSETPTLPASTPIPPSSTPAPDYLSRLRNAEYQLADSQRPVQLTDGQFQEGTAGQADYVSVNIGNFTAAGDLNGDGVDEVAAVFGENYGGSGTFVFLAIYSDVNGKLTFLTSAFVGDRSVLNGLSIENGEVALSAVTHAADDPLCCPTMQTHRHYSLVAENQLQMIDFSSLTPDGQPRTITIESPVHGEQVDNAIQMKGSVTIAPFENNLVYRVFSTGEVELASGSIMVTAAEMGGPGTFDSIIALGNILSGAVVRVEIQDLSAADGSLLAMDSVELVVK
jgi:immunoglobulin-like protein involved in spore germination